MEEHDLKSICCLCGRKEDPRRRGLITGKAEDNAKAVGVGKAGWGARGSWGADRSGERALKGEGTEVLGRVKRALMPLGISDPLVVRHFYYASLTDEKMKA